MLVWLTVAAGEGDCSTASTTTGSSTTASTTTVSSVSTTPGISKDFIPCRVGLQTAV